MESFFLLLPIFFTSFVSLLHPFISNNILVFEYLVRIYFSYFLGLYFIIALITEIVSQNKLLLKNIFLLNIAYMFNFMNGFVFIPVIVDKNLALLLNQIILVVFISCNILSIIYIYHHNYLELNKYLNRQYNKHYICEDSDYDSNNENIIDEDLDDSFVNPSYCNMNEDSEEDKPFVNCEVIYKKLN